MEQKDLLTLNLSKQESSELIAFCKLNEMDLDELIIKSFKQGYYIEKHGLLGKWDEAIEKMGGVSEIQVEKEVIVEKRVEVPVEVIKEVIIEKEIIKEVPVEKIIEVTKEVPVEKVVIQEVIKEVPVDRVVEKEVYITDDEQVNQLGGKITKLGEEKNELLFKIQQLDFDKNQLLSKIQQLSSDNSSLDSRLQEEMNKPPVEVIKEVEVVNTEKNKLLQETISKLQTQIRDKDKKISELEEVVSSFSREIQGIRGTFLRSSNLNDDLYK